MRTATLLGGFGLSGLASASFAATKSSFKPVKFGLIADIHQNHYPNVIERLDAFMAQVEIEKPDFLISLGDFCFPIPENEPFAKRFASSTVPAFHALGNHEMDKNSKDEVVDFLKMPNKYYSVDAAGYHLVFLDPNNIYSGGRFIDYEKSNYFKHGGNVSYMDDEQCDWLRDDLAKTKLPTFLFSHQSLLHDNGGIPNRAFVKGILKTTNDNSVRDGNGRKILGCFNGHHHRDAYREIDGIHYFSINSVSYFYSGIKTPHRLPDEEAYKKFGSLDKSVPYRDPLFSFVMIGDDGTLSLKGKKTEWIGPAFEGPTSPSVRYSQGDAIPEIRDRNVKLG